MPWYWYLALKQLFPSGKKLSFFSVMSIVGVALGVMVLLVVLSVMTGFQDRIRETISGKAGDIRVLADQIIYNWQGLEKELKSKDFVQAVSPYAEGIMMLQHKNRPAFPFTRGVDVLTESEVTQAENYIIEGSWDELDDQSVILSSGLAKGLSAGIGAAVDVYTPLMLERLKDDEVLLPRELKVVGISETGNNSLDAANILVSLRLMQDLYGMRDGIHGFTLKLKEGTHLEKATFALNKSLPKGFRAMNWLDMNEDFLMVLKLEKTIMFFIIIFIILVASFSVTSNLLASVIRKTHEIGLIAAMGGRLRHIALCFCLQGFVIGLAGTCLGIVGAILGLYFRNDLIHWLAGITRNQETLARFYQFADLPAHMQSSDILLVVISTIVIATFAGLMPAIRVMKLKPVEALRNE